MGQDLLKRLKQKEDRQREREQPKQPKRCKGCSWGRWDGLKQYCMRMPCVREDVKPEVVSVQNGAHP